MAPHKWTTPEQEALLLSTMPEYQKYMPSKNYLEFWPKINHKFFAQWLVHKHVFPEVTNEEDLNNEQNEDVKKAMKQQKQQIVCWYHWQTNHTHLACVGGSRGVLSIGETLSRGACTKALHAPKELEVYSQLYYTDCVKGSADEVIANGGITSHGSKLRVRCEITAEKYEAESAAVKEKVQKRYQKLSKKFKQVQRATKSKESQDVDEDTKVNYHLGEGADGGQFTDSYVKYSNVLKGFASFVESTIKYEESLPVICSGHDSEVEENVDESSEDSSDGSDLEGDENHSGDQEHEKQAIFDLEAALDELTPIPNNEFNASHMLQLNLPKAFKTLLFDYNAIDYNSLQPADYEAALSSFLEVSLHKSDFGMAASDSNLPPLPPVGWEVPVLPYSFTVPQSIEPAGPALAAAFQPPAFQMTRPPTPTDLPPTPPTVPTPPAMTGPPTPPASQTSPPASGPPTPPATQMPPPAFQMTGPSTPLASQTSPPASGSPTPPATQTLPPAFQMTGPSTPPTSQTLPPTVPTPSAMTRPPTPLMSQSVLAALGPEPLSPTVLQPAHHIEDEQPGVQCTGRTHRAVPFNRCELDNVIGDTPRQSGQVGGENPASTQASKHGNKRNAENACNMSRKLVYIGDSANFLFNYFATLKAEYTTTFFRLQVCKHELDHAWVSRLHENFGAWEMPLLRLSEILDAQEMLLFRLRKAIVKTSIDSLMWGKSGTKWGMAQKERKGTEGKEVPTHFWIARGGGLVHVLASARHEHMI
ncbi:hypothetical protein BDR05DRAFT_949843 [Suillus weaverae]|nr:hypothetical protein BDR05DRAFT_949843 [Suillus weaverae]